MQCDLRVCKSNVQDVVNFEKYGMRLTNFVRIIASKPLNWLINC